MPLNQLITVFLFLFLTGSFQSFAQCTTQTGPPPAAVSFNTARDDGGIVLSSSENDPHWKIAKDSITGEYLPAIIMGPLDPVYYAGRVSRWISFSLTGEHTSNRYFFYKKDFDLPCFNLCGKSYDDDNTFCLNLDLYTDNSVFEIYVNGIPQSGNLGNIIPILPDPFNPPRTQSEKTSVSLCKDWKAGNNTLIIQVASSATVVGMLAEAAIAPPPPPDAHLITATICEGEHFLFGNLDLTQPGSYFQTFPQPGGCDSTVALTLTVKPNSHTEISQSICEGETYAGYSTTGIYTDTFQAANGCDSVRTLELFVQEKPRPDLGNITALCKTDSLVLSPGSFLSYTWQDGSTQNPYVVKQPGFYSVTVSNTCGTAQDEILITDGTCNVFFPSAFTPNQDGKNDLFRILTSAVMEQFQLSIYNRWGQEIYRSANPSKGWDGTLNGVEQPSSVFIWICTFRREGITTTMKGKVVLIR